MAHPLTTVHTGGRLEPTWYDDVDVVDEVDDVTSLSALDVVDMNTNHRSLGALVVYCRTVAVVVVGAS